MHEMWEMALCWVWWCEWAENDLLPSSHMKLGIWRIFFEINIYKACIWEIKTQTQTTMHRCGPEVCTIAVLNSSWMLLHCHWFQSICLPVAWAHISSWVSDFSRSSISNNLIGPLLSMSLEGSSDWSTTHIPLDLPPWHVASWATLALFTQYHQVIWI